jgi:hypothetical protein
VRGSSRKANSHGPPNAHNAKASTPYSAMVAEQTFEGRREALSQANKLSRTYAVLLEALNRHRVSDAGRTVPTFRPTQAALRLGVG